MKKFSKKIALILALTLGVMSLSGCASKQNSTSNKDAENKGAVDKIRVSVQYGYSYAPLTILDKKPEILKKYLPNAEIEWVSLSGGTATNEALISGNLDFAFFGTAPFLIGWDKGIKYKLATALCNMPVSLQVNDSNIKSLKDIKPTDKIAVPALGSIQHILLAMEAEKELGSATALDDNIVAMAHGDALTALESGKEITGHMATPPYNYQEVEKSGISKIVDATQAVGGEYTLNLGVATTDFHDKRPDLYSGFISAFNEAVNYVNTEPKETAKLLADSEGVSVDKAYEYLTYEGTNFTTTPYGILGIAEFMKNSGYIKKVPASVNEISFENVSAAVGQQYGEKSAIEKLQGRDTK